MRLPHLSHRLTVRLLIGSVCLNLFAAAAFVTGLVGPDHPRGPAFGLVERAPDDARPILMAAFEAHKDEMHGNFEAVRAAATEVGRLIAEGETDPQRLGTAFADLRQAFDRVEVLTHEIIIATLPELSSEDRAAWGQVWMRGPRR